MDGTDPGAAGGSGGAPGWARPESVGGRVLREAALGQPWVVPLKKECPREAPSRDDRRSIAVATARVGSIASPELMIWQFHARVLHVGRKAGWSAGRARAGGWEETRDAGVGVGEPFLPLGGSCPPCPLPTSTDYEDRRTKGRCAPSATGRMRSSRRAEAYRHGKGIDRTWKEQTGALNRSPPWETSKTSGPNRTNISPTPSLIAFASLAAWQSVIGPNRRLPPLMSPLSHACFPQRVVRFAGGTR